MSHWPCEDLDHKMRPGDRLRISGLGPERDGEYIVGRVTEDRREGVYVERAPGFVREQLERAISPFTPARV